MAIASPSAPTFSATLCRTRTASASYLSRFSYAAFPHRTSPHTRRLVVSSRFNSSKPSDAGGGSVSPDDGDGKSGKKWEDYELQYCSGAPRKSRRGSPVFVTLPLDMVALEERKVRRKKAMVFSLRALASAGVEGVVMEVWWGLVEREMPGVYDWGVYLELVELLMQCGLKVRAVMAFHQSGNGPSDPHWIPLPRWVLDEIDKNPDLTYSDRFGRRSLEYISLGCDTLPLLRGRSPIQVYADFMRNFRDTFRSFLGVIITGIQVGMGPAGELRYPSCPSRKLTWSWRVRELGEFQCYDKYILASLNAYAHEIGMREWGNGGPIGSGSLMHDPEATEFFKSDGYWNSAYGRFFLEWYSGMLLLHAERMCRVAEAIFRGIDINTSAKVAGIHWHYGTASHPSELTAGYYNTAIRDGFMPIARLFSKYRFTLCCPGFELKNLEEKQLNPLSSPEGFLRQLLVVGQSCDIHMEGENCAAYLDEGSLQQVLKMTKFYLAGLPKSSFSFNFVRMDRYMFEQRNWNRFTRFVKQMADANIFRAKLEFGAEMRLSDCSKVGVACACC